MPESRDKFILSLDGGGIRGLMSTVVLARIEREIGRPLSECFDLIAGTSSGSVIAGGLAIGPDGRQLVKTERLAEFFAQDGPRIFTASQSSFVSKIRWLWGPVHDISRLRATIENRVGDVMLSDISNRILITAYDMRMGEPLLFQSWLAGGKGSRGAHARSMGEGVTELCPTRTASDLLDFSLADAIVSSSAVPTFFAPVRIPRGADEHFALVDGFVYALNPVIPAYFAARRLYGAEHRFRILSIGTGKYEKRYTWRDLRKRGALKWLRPMLEAFPDGVSDASETYMDWMAEIAGIEHIRVKTVFDQEKYPDSPNPEMDDASPENLGRLRTAGERMYDAHADRLAPLVADLRVHARARMAATS